jgi:hypothetical protein
MANRKPKAILLKIRWRSDSEMCPNVTTYWFRSAKERDAFLYGAEEAVDYLGGKIVTPADQGTN